MTSRFDELITVAEGVSVEGWDFAWLDGRATEERPPWGYSRLLAERMARADASLDLQTGGGEVLAGVGTIPKLAVATESHPPNLAKATSLLHPLGVAVVSVPEQPPLPFANSSFDLVTSRHPDFVWWGEIARLLRPGGTYFAQHVGPGSGFELIEYFLGPQPEARRARHPDAEARDAQAAGLDIVDIRSARLRIELHDVGAVVYLLRKLVWWVPGFTVGAYGDRLRELHELIRREGPFVAHSTRHLIEVRRPT
jgi:SAM-dependent methyltransferase